MQTTSSIRHDSYMTRPGDGAWRWLARRLPARLRYWTVIDAWSATSSERCPPVRAPALTVSELVDLMDE